MNSESRTHKIFPRPARLAELQIRQDGNGGRHGRQACGGGGSAVSYFRRLFRRSSASSFMPSTMLCALRCAPLSEVCVWSFLK